MANYYIKRFKVNGVEVRDLVVPGTVTTVNPYAFYCCGRIKSLKLCSGTEHVGDYAFSGCPLTAIDFPDSLSDVGYSAVNGEKLKEINVESVEGWLNIRFKSNPLRTSDYIPKVFRVNGTTVNKIVIPDTVKSVRKGAFAGVNSITSIHIPKGVTVIEESAFNDCFNLGRVELPDGLLEIGDKSFCSCIKLKTINLPESLVNIEAGAFSSCKSLTKVDFPLGLVRIGDYAFNSCDGLTAIEIPASVISIDHEAFTWCTNIKKVSINSNETNIGKEAFSYCDNLQNVFIKTDGHDNITINSLSNVTQSFTYQGPTIETRAFYNCPKLKSLAIPETYTEIKSNVFKGCKQMEMVVILNPDCEITDNANTIARNSTVYGIKGSTAEAYAKKYGRKFKSIDADSFIAGIDSSMVSLSSNSYTYDGRKKTPKFTIVEKNQGKIGSKFYDVKYQGDRKNIGTHYVNVSMKNGYIGNVKKKAYTIKPKGTSIKTPSKAKSGFTAKWSKQSAKMSKNRITGYIVQYSTNAKFSGAKSKTVKGYTKTSQKITKLKSNKTYYVRVRTYMKVGSITYYSNWSSAKKVTTK